MLNEVNYKILSVVSESIVDDPAKRDMLARVKKDGYALQYASEELKGDREIVQAAVSQVGYALQFASAQLRGDREIVLVAVSQKGYALRYASDEMKGDREIVLAAVSQSKYALQYASAELRGNQEVVLAAVRQDGKALEYASDKLKDDPYIVMHAFANDHRAFSVASSTLKNGGLRSYVEEFIVQYNVSKQTFIATILFGAKHGRQGDGQESVGPASSRPRLSDDSTKSALRLLQPSTALPGHLSTQIKQKIWWYAGVRSGERWRVIEAAARNLGIEIPG